MSIFESMGRQAADDFIKEANLANVAKTVGTGLLKTPEFLKNTFYPGASLLKNRLANTARVYSNSSFNPESLANAKGQAGERLLNSSFYSNLADKVKNRPLGNYYPKHNVAVARAPIGSAQGKSVMRHELTHGVQHNTPQYENSFNGVLARMNNSENPWMKALSTYGQELGAHSAQGKGLMDQLMRGGKFILSPERAKAYSKMYGKRFGTSDLLGDRYSFVHNTINKAAPIAAGTTLAVPTLGAANLAYSAATRSNYDN